MSDLISLTMPAAEKAALQRDVDFFNKTLNEGRVVNKDLGKDDFLKILITQLTHQDPTKPMEDKEFIAQMAQFSTLEQITNMNKEITNLSGSFSNNQAFALLGKNVDIVEGERFISGTVDRVIGGEVPQVSVNGEYYNYEDISSVSLGNLYEQRAAANAYDKSSTVTKAAPKVGVENAPPTENTREAEMVGVSNASEARVKAEAKVNKENDTAIPPEELNGNIIMEIEEGGSGL